MKKYTLDDLNKRLAQMISEREGGVPSLSSESIRDEVRRNKERNAVMAADVQKYGHGVVAKGTQEAPKKTTHPKPKKQTKQNQKQAAEKKEEKARPAFSEEKARPAFSDVYGLSIKSRLSEKERDAHGLKSRTNAGKERSNKMGEEWYEDVRKGNKARTDGNIIHTPIVKLLFGTSKADADDKKKKGR